jgi:protein-tyrosine phosphatase
MKTLLMVCMGNICRSPMAKTVMQKMVQGAGLSAELIIDSAGTHAQHLGERPDPRAVAALLRRGYIATPTRSRRLIAQDYEKSDLILAMDTDNLTEIRRTCPPQHQDKLKLFLDFSQELPASEVPDPYYGNQQGFERVLDLCEAGARGLIKHYTP